MDISLVEELGRPKRIRLLVDGELRKKISCYLVPLSEVRSIIGKEDFFERLLDLEVKGGIRYTLSLLARQSLHSKKLERSLRRHFLESDVIERVVSHCQTRGWLNDDEWVQNKIIRMQSQGKSVAQVKASFRKDGIEKTAVSFDENASLEKVVLRKYPQLLEETTPYAQRVRALQALLRRGFSYSSVQEFLQKKKLLRMMSQDVEE